MSIFLDLMNYVLRGFFFLKINNDQTPVTIFAKTLHHRYFVGNDLCKPSKVVLHVYWQRFWKLFSGYSNNAYILWGTKACLRLFPSYFLVSYFYLAVVSFYKRYSIQERLLNLRKKFLAKLLEMRKYAVFCNFKF